MRYSNFTDKQLIGLLYSGEDRLPRAAVDEFVKRAGMMVEPLAEIAGNNFRRGYPGLGASHPEGNRMDKKSVAIVKSFMYT